MLLQRLPNTDARVATTVAAVKALLAEMSFRPGVAIIDQHLPDGRGVDLIGEIRSRTPDIRKIVVMSATMSPEIESAARLAGADSLFSKIEMCNDIGRWVLNLLGPEARAA
jgi:DNA-binding NarL/FixJ family response regulator